MKRSTLLLLGFLNLGILFSQDDFQNTLFYDSIAGSPKANIEELSWIAGNWQGEAFGGIVEELWSLPLGGSMMGSFKLVVGDQVKFYELETISQENGTLILRLKHFGSDLKGWEEKDETVDFKLVKIEGNKVYFDGFTFEKINEKEMNIYVVIDNKGEKREVKFPYKLVNQIRNK